MTGITGVTFPTSGTLATTSQIPTGAALTKTDDTNVTLTLGGSPTTALVNAASLTLGWTGTLSGTRGGTGVNNGASTITIGGNVTFSGGFTFAGTITGNTAVTFPTSGTLLTSASAVTSITGTANQITASASVGAVTLAIASNPVIPGSAGITLPTGNTAAQAGAAGTIRFNSQTTVFEGTLDGATWTPFSTAAGTVVSVSGTANRITSTGGTTPVIDISASYVGQSSITTLGTIATGVWNGTTIAVANGGTGITSFGTGVATALGQNVTGSGGIALATSPSFTTPSLGVATATSINKVAITAPATSATLTIADGKTLTVSNTLTFTGTDSSSVNFGTGGTVLYASSAITTIAVQSFTANGTYTPTSGMKYCIVELVGGGGGSGGVVNTASYAASTGGSAGGYAKVLLTAAQIGASKTVTIGAAGAAGTNAGAGGQGGTTSLSTLISCTGGNGSPFAASGFVIYPPGAGGVPTVTTGTAIATSNGAPGTLGATSGGTIVACGGTGASSPFGGGGIGVAASAVGIAGNGYGSGGGGSASLNAAQTGAAGGAGYLVVTEYI
jgi:hypothetical protein